MNKEKLEELVVLKKVEHARYPNVPFHPPVAYSELQQWWPGLAIDSTNEVYTAVREALRAFQFDEEHYGTQDWNSLKEFVQPGNRVIIKPNLVFHKHPLGEYGVRAMITHGSVLRPLIEYAWIALEGRGEIIVCDVPLQTADWETLMIQSGIGELVRYLQGVGINVTALDLRLEHAFSNKYGVIVSRKEIKGDPLGYVPVDLGKMSMLSDVVQKHRGLTITDYPQWAVSAHHNRERNEYLIAKTVLSSDVFINVPKLKTHKKAGVTLAMKNLIGINGDKSWIAHHREGVPQRGGDEAPERHWWDAFRYHIFVTLKNSILGIRILTVLLWFLDKSTRIARNLMPRRTGSPLAVIRKFRGITEGSWYGNDTLWRVILDLTRILLYSTPDGIMKSAPQRKTLQVIDGIIGGERDGPMHHIPKHAGVIIAGVNPLITDTVAAEYMGFDSKKVPQLREGFAPMKYPIVSLHSLGAVSINEGSLMVSFSEWQKSPTRSFLSPSTWEGKIEHSRRDKEDQTTEIPEILEEGGGE